MQGNAWRGVHTLHSLQQGQASGLCNMLCESLPLSAHDIDIAYAFDLLHLHGNSHRRRCSLSAQQSRAQRWPSRREQSCSTRCTLWICRQHRHWMSCTVLAVQGSIRIHNVE